MGLDGKAADYWSVPADRLTAELASSATGLSRAEAARRLSRHGPNLVVARPQATALRLFLRQFESPLVLILVFAAVISAIVRDWTDAVIIGAILLGSAVLSFFQEYRAANAVARLQAHSPIKATVVRDGRPEPFRPMASCPATWCCSPPAVSSPPTALVLEAKDFFVSQAVLTGETFPVEKEPGAVAGRSQPRRAHQLRLHGHIGAQRHGARADRRAPAARTAFGEIADRLRAAPAGDRVRARHPPLRLPADAGHAGARAAWCSPPTCFSDRPPIDSLLFAVALAVGLSPELLPAIISVDARRAGARKMAERA